MNPEWVTASGGVIRPSHVMARGANQKPLTVVREGVLSFTMRGNFFKSYPVKCFPELKIEVLIGRSFVSKIS